MTQLFIRILLCISPTQCETGSSQFAPVPFNTELECEESGLKLIRDNAGLKGRVVFCPKVITTK